MIQAAATPPWRAPAHVKMAADKAAAKQAITKKAFAMQAITKQAEIYLGLDMAVDCRRFINPETSRLHGGRPGSLSHTRCGLAIPGGSGVSILEALASGEAESSEISMLCKKCFRESKLS